MPKYSVEFTVTKHYTIEIEAKDEEDAEDLIKTDCYDDDEAREAYSRPNIIVNGVSEIEEE